MLLGTAMSAAAAWRVVRDEARVPALVDGAEHLDQSAN
jgi:hypothetical protein